MTARRGIWKMGRRRRGFEIEHGGRRGLFCFFAFRSFMRCAAGWLAGHGLRTMANHSLIIESPSAVSRARFALPALPTGGDEVAAGEKGQGPKKGQDKAKGVALKATVEQGRELPDELLVAPWGEFQALDGTKLRVGEITLKELARNQELGGFDEVVLDFEHNSFSKLTDADGKPIPPVEPIRVAAYGVLSVEKGRGVILTISHWTKEGAEYFSNGHYKDLSPTVFFDKNGEVFFIHSVALTRTGQVKGLQALSALLSVQNSQQQNEPDELSKAMDSEMKYKNLLLKMLSLDSEASDEEIAAAMSAMESMAAKPDGGSEAMSKATPAAVPDNMVSKEDFAALSSRFEDMRKQGLIDQAGQAGKALPLSAQAVKAMSYDDLRETIDKLPAGEVPLSSKTPGGVKEEQRTKVLSAGQKQIAANLGLKEDDYLAGLASN